MQFTGHIREPVFCPGCGREAEYHDLASACLDIEEDWAIRAEFVCPVCAVRFVASHHGKTWLAGAEPPEPSPQGEDAEWEQLLASLGTPEGTRALLDRFRAEESDEPEQAGVEGPRRCPGTRSPRRARASGGRRLVNPRGGGLSGRARQGAT